MEPDEPQKMLTLAARMGELRHFSPLLRRLERLSGCSRERIPAWLLKCAVERGAVHYRRDFASHLPPDNPSVSNEELGVGLCLAHHPFDPKLIRAAAQLLSAPDTETGALMRLAVMERCEPVLLHIAEAAQRFAPFLEPWRTVQANMPRRHHARRDALPHWSRFVLQTGYTPAGRGQHIEWLMRGE